MSVNTFVSRIFLLLILSALSLTSLYAAPTYSYSYTPKKVYENQLFPLTIMAKNRDIPTQFTFEGHSTIPPISTKPLIVKNGNDTFYTFYFKAKKRNIDIPVLRIITADTSTYLDALHIPVTKLSHIPKNFSNILAADIKIKNSQVSHYDATYHIVTLAIEAYEANIEDMKIAQSKEYGIENITRIKAKVNAEFFAVIPRTQKVLKFTYFNTINKRYMTLEVPVKVVNASVTTQSDLNPKVDAFDRLKRYTLIALALFFLIMFIWKRDLLYLILGLVSLVTLLTFYIPYKKICVKQGTALYILPTYTSTISMRIDKQLDTVILGERGAFKKIEVKQGIIGWIKDENTCDN